MRIKVKKARVATVKQLRVCAYIRVSSATDETEDSFDTQRQHFIEHIGANPEWIYAGVYADFGISGFFKERPGFQSMMADARAGKFDLVLVKSVSRFARNTETFLNATRELKRLGIGVYFELQQINSLTQAGELMLTIKAAFAQGESDSSSELMKMTYRRKFSQGIATPFSAKTYGFKPGEDKSICVDEPRARIVRFIFDMADMGIWHTKIADELNKQHIPAPEGKAWNGCQISRMIRNVMYKGDLLLQKNFRDAQHKNHKNRGEVQRWYIKENHPAIVSSKLWERVQLSEREPVHSTDIPPVGGRSSHQYKGDALLQKFVNLDYLTGRSVKNNGAVEQYYVKGSHEAIIPAERWELVQLELQRRDAFRRKHNLRSFGRYTETQPFANKIFCGECGILFNRKTGYRLAGDIKSWVCADRFKKEGRPGCVTNIILRESDLYRGFITAWNTMLRHRDDCCGYWQNRMKSSDPLTAFFAKRFIELMEDAQPLRKIDNAIVRKTLEHVVVQKTGLLVFYFLDGSRIEIPIHK